MFGLHPADLVAVGLYFVGVTVAGIWAARKVHSLSDFVMPRRFGKAFMMMHGFGTSTHSDQAVSVASKSFTSGLSGIWYQWMWLFATPFYWLIAPMMRRFRALTTADVFEARFDRSVALLFVVVGLGKFMLVIGMMLKGTGVIIEACTDGQLPENVMILAMTVMFVVYGLAGGLGAAIITDFIQGILTIVFSFLLLPFVMSAVGGMAGLRESLPQVTGRDDMLSLVAPGEIGVFFIAVIALNSLLSVAVQPHNMGTCAAGKTETEGAVGFMGGNLIKRFCTVAWCFTGLAAVVYYQGQVENPDHVYGMMAREFLPEILPGLLGVFLAALLATVMGSCDSFMIAASGLITENLYRPLVPNRSQRHYLWVARVAALLVVVGGVTLAYTAEGVVRMLEQMWKVDAMMAMAFWLGIFWRRTTVAGAWAATVAAMVVWFVSSRAGVAEWLSQFEGLVSSGVVRTREGAGWQLWLPWQMLSYLVAGFGVGWLVSRFTRPVPAVQLDRFYGLLRTPVQKGEILSQPCTLPQGIEAAPRRVFFPSSDWEIPIPGRRAVLGFVAGWLVVGGIIGGVWVWVETG